MKGERIAELRKDKRMTQEQLGKQLNVAQETISSYEKERTQVPDDIKVKMADYFGVTTDYLLGRTREPMSIDTVIKKLPSKAEHEMKQYLIYFFKSIVIQKQAGSKANPQRKGTVPHKRKSARGARPTPGRTQDERGRGRLLKRKVCCMNKTEKPKQETFLKKSGSKATPQHKITVPHQTKGSAGGAAGPR